MRKFVKGRVDMHAVLNTFLRKCGNGVKVQLQVEALLFLLLAYIMVKDMGTVQMNIFELLLSAIVAN